MFEERGAGVHSVTCDSREHWNFICKTDDNFLKNLTLIGIADNRTADKSTVYHSLTCVLAIQGGWSFSALLVKIMFTFLIFFYNFCSEENVKNNWV